MSQLRRLTFLSRDELQDLIRRREAILMAEEQAAVQAALDNATPAEHANLLRLLGRAE